MTHSQNLNNNNNNTLHWQKVLLFTPGIAKLNVRNLVTVVMDAATAIATDTLTSPKNKKETKTNKYKNKIERKGDEIPRMGQ